MDISGSNVFSGGFSGLSSRVLTLQDISVIRNIRIAGTALLSIGIITCIIFLLINITRLGASLGNEKARSEALIGIGVCGFCISLLGGLNIYLNFFWHIFR